MIYIFSTQVTIISQPKQKYADVKQYYCQFIILQKVLFQVNLDIILACKMYLLGPILDGIFISEQEKGIHLRL